MKQTKFLFASLFLFLFSSNTFSQGNLQFSQVITLGEHVTGGYPSASSIWTVPSNKVWKIEYKTPTGLLYPANSSFLVNSVPFDDIISTFYNASNNQYGMTAVTIKQGPIWLKAGDQIQFKVMPVNNTNWPGNNSWDFSLSIIEYNIVP